MATSQWVQDEEALMGAPEEGTFSVLGESECYSLLHEGVVGRVAFREPQLMILPITYDWVDGLVVFKTAASSSLSALAGQHVAFEVDDIDAETGVGWSVVVQGTVEDAEAAQANGVTPWAAGKRDLVLAIRPHSVSGRVVSRPEEGN